MAEEQEGQQAEQEAQPPLAEEAPQQEGPQYDYDPELVRLTYEENKRRERELERREREFQQKLRESERQRQYIDPSMAAMDPVQQSMLEWMRRADERERQREEREERQRETQQWIEQTSREMDATASYLARQSGMTPDQLDALNLEQVVLDLYKSQDAIRAVGADYAIRKAFEYATRNGNRGYPASSSGQPRIRPQMREAVIPVGAVQQNATRQDDDPRRRPGETTEQWVMRLRKMDEEQGGVAPRIPEGQRVVIE